MNSPKLWIEALRPKTLPAALCPVITGTAGALLVGVRTWTPLPLVIAAALMLQITANLANDLLDHIQGDDTSARKGPRRMTASGLISPWAMMAAVAVALGLCGLLGLPLVWFGGWPILAIGASAMAFGILYSLGPWSLSRLGLGELFVFPYFGPLASAGTAALLTGRWSLDAAALGIVPGLISMALLAVNNTRDREEDRITGKRTLAVRLGSKAVWEYPVLLIAGALTALVLGLAHPLFLLSALPFLRLVRMIPDWLKIRNPRARNPFLGKTGKLNLESALCLLGTTLLLLALRV